VFGLLPVTGHDMDKRAIENNYELTKSPPPLSLPKKKKES
jgi:hypothetical protein